MQIFPENNTKNFVGKKTSKNSSLLPNILSAERFCPPKFCPIRYQELSPHNFQVSTYGGGGFTQLLGNNREDALKKLAVLKENLWLDRGTRAVFIDLTVYNANINLFCIITLIFEYPGMIPR